MGGGIDIVFLDIGGVLYDDTIYARAWERALREAGASFDDDAFDSEYTIARAEQRGSFRRRLTDRFLGVGADVERVERIAAQYWSYPPTAVHDDVRPTLELLRGRYRLGIVANQPSEVRSAMHRDGLETFFEIWAVSDDLGVRKPDPRLFEMALEVAHSEPDRAVMVGDRLDYDVRPAKAAGMRAVWMLRGEAPDQPTAEQLAEADGAVGSMVELPQLLASWSA
jgi:HAD superfamily hydrolase (TIGR01549 family)